MDNNNYTGKPNYRPVERPIAQTETPAAPKSGMLQTIKNVVTSKEFILGTVLLVGTGVVTYLGCRRFFSKKKATEEPVADADNNE